MDELVLEDKGHTDARVEASEVRRHGRDAEVRALDISVRSTVLDVRTRFGVAI